MNAIISNGDYTVSVQLPVEGKQLAGALSYLGKNHASAYDIKYNEETYSESVCKVKNYELHLDLQEAKDDTMKALDETIEKTKKLQDRAIKDKQADPKYKEAKNEAMNIISLLASNKLIRVAIIAGSKAWILILLGLEAKLAPALINSS